MTERMMNTFVPFSFLTTTVLSTLFYQRYFDIVFPFLGKNGFISLLDVKKNKDKLEELLFLSAVNKERSEAMKRVDSEFSLGLNRNNSIDDHLMELGGFCSPVQSVINVVRTPLDVLLTNPTLFPATILGISMMYFYIKEGSRKS
jgi:hypothetical protein